MREYRFKHDHLLTEDEVRDVLAMYLITDGRSIVKDIEKYADHEPEDLVKVLYVENWEFSGHPSNVASGVHEWQYPSIPVSFTLYQNLEDFSVMFGTEID